MGVQRGVTVDASELKQMSVGNELNSHTCLFL